MKKKLEKLVDMMFIVSFSVLLPMTIASESVSVGKKLVIIAILVMLLAVFVANTLTGD